MFTAVTDHNTPLVIHYDHELVDPIFGAIETAVFARSDLSARRALHQAALLRDRTRSARTAITVAFAAGLLLLAAFSLILVGLRRRVGAAHRSEVERLASAALTDSLTGLGNHRAFQEDVANALHDQVRGRGSVTLIMLDLDGLKAVNDAHGHQAGDDRLRVLAEALAESFRDSDCAYRVGGDEFAVVLPGISTWDALEATQRLQTALGAHALRVTAGIAQSSEMGDADGFIRDADLALIAGKRPTRPSRSFHPSLLSPRRSWTSIAMPITSAACQPRWRWPSTPRTPTRAATARRCRSCAS